MTGTVTVFASSDPAEVLTAKMILDAEEIRYVVEGEGVQDLFGFGRALGPFNPITGPVQLRVAKENAERALEALNSIWEDDEE